MKIVGVKVLEFRRRLDGRTWNPGFRWHERRAPLLVVETDAGLAGVGEAWSRQEEVALVLDDLVDRCAPALLGCDPLLRERIVAQLPPPVEFVEPWIAAASASAVDIALWDLSAQVARQPLWRALGGGSGRVAVYASGGLYRDRATLDDLVRESGAHVADGFTAIKMKIGALPLEADLERVRSVRRGAGDGVVLWVDAVNRLTRDSALRWCTSLAEAGVAAIQAPLPFDDILGMAGINASSMPVVADERAHRERQFRALLDAGAVTFLQYCVGLCGGFTGAMKLDDNAAVHGVQSTPQCFSTAVMQAASLHFGASRANVGTVEFHRFHDHLASAMPAAMKTVAAGFVHLDDTPGLGIAPPVPGAQAGGGDVRLHGHLTLPTHASHA